MSWLSIMNEFMYGTRSGYWEGVYNKDFQNGQNSQKKLKASLTK